MGSPARPRHLRGDQRRAVRLVKGKITLVHRRLWPALVRVAPRYPDERVGALHEEHLPSGRHRTATTPFPDWVPPDVVAAANALTDAQADAELGLPAERESRG